MKTEAIFFSAAITLLASSAYGQDFCFPNDTNEIELLSSGDELATLCKSLNESDASTTHVVTISTCLDMNVTKSMNNLCKENGSTYGYLRWMSWTYFTINIRPLLPTVPSRLLILQLTNLTSPMQLTSLTEEQAQDSSRILVEMLPISYKFTDLTEKSNNRILKYIRRQNLALSKIENLSNETKIVNGNIPYGYQRKIDVNFNLTNLKPGLPVDMNNGYESLPTSFILGQRYTRDEVTANTFSKVLFANTTLNISLIGIWTKSEQILEGTMVPLFIDGKTISSLIGQIQANIEMTAITNVNRVYNAGDEAMAAGVVTTLMPTLVFDEPILEESAEYEAIFQRPPRSDSVYPGFRPYFHWACLIVFGAIAVVAIDIGRQLLNDRKIRNSDLQYSNYRKV